MSLALCRLLMLPHMQSALMTGGPRGAREADSTCGITIWLQSEMLVAWFVVYLARRGENSCHCQWLCLSTPERPLPVALICPAHAADLKVENVRPASSISD